MQFQRLKKNSATAPTKAALINLKINRMEIKNIHKQTDWYASHEKSEQGAALILCQQLKIKQLSDVIKIIEGEIELTENLQEFSHEAVIRSIKELIKTIPNVSYTKGYFKWEG